MSSKILDSTESQLPSTPSLSQRAFRVLTVIFDLGANWKIYLAISLVAFQILKYGFVLDLTNVIAMCFVVFTIHELYQRIQAFEYVKRIEQQADLAEQRTQALEQMLERFSGSVSGVLQVIQDPNFDFTQLAESHQDVSQIIDSYSSNFQEANAGLENMQRCLTHLRSLRSLSERLSTEMTALRETATSLASTTHLLTQRQEELAQVNEELVDITAQRKLLQEQFGHLLDEIEERLNKSHNDQADSS